MIAETVVLVGGPGAGQQVEASGSALPWRACLYERTSDRQRVRGVELRVYGHRADCCEGYGRGDVDRCE
jgi:hypothetical protein